jgi:uncharacterized membrane protein YfcA
VELFDLLWIAACVAVAGFSQSISGFGFALIAVPLMSIAVDPRVAVVVSTFVGSVASSSQAFAGRRHVVRPIAVRMAAASCIGMPLGLAAFVVFSERALRVTVGVAVLFALATLVAGFRLPPERHRFDWILGMFSGALATSTSTNGPPLVFVLQARGLEPDAFRATINAVFTVANAGAIALFVAAGKVNVSGLVGAAVAIPVLAVTMRLGFVVRDRLSAEGFRTVVFVLLGVAGVSALGAALAM